MRLFPAPRLGVRIVEHCPVCSSARIEYEFTVDQRPVARCLDCTMLFLREPGKPPPSNLDVVVRARVQVARIREMLPPGSGKLLVVLAPGTSATIDGCDVVALDGFPGSPGQMYDGAVCVDVLDRAEDPGGFLEALRATVRTGAPVSFTQPSVDSASAQYGGASWWGFRSGASLFFGVDTLQSLLIRYGFRHPRTYFDGRLKRGSLRVRTAGRLLNTVRLRKTAARAQRRIGILDESLTLVCRSEVPIARHKLSVIVPVFNEHRTFRLMMEQLVEKQIDGVDIEIIVVESNSTDGSRDDVLSFASRANVSVILQDAPKGKGNAVRAGIERASGDVILIQDADLEYEIEDYDELVRPIRAYQRNFVIGSRHVKDGSAWKIRDFNDAPVLSQVFNVGHVVFLGLLNSLYDQRLNDPFSMFKLFRRDCIAGLTFECNRFDFDFEIVIKLLRKGYRPVEIPVNYHSRSIKEGKKVTMVRDPLSWLRALVRFRTSELY
jgi:hypothetical protein